ncbi:tRNA (N(6)-L-threonylcarbamoyladenosine(37)-C(2))-methylthiotransferase MtaB [Chloroflexota bacterium]
MKIALATLGCKLNQAETEIFARQFAGNGHRLVSSVEDADIYILNTCTVTHVADGKSRHLLRQAHRRNPNALVVATGCYSQRMPGELTRIEGVDLVMGNDEKPQLLQRLREAGYLGRHVREEADGSNEDTLRTRAFIKIQDGCHKYCAYCVVPLVRGREHSLSAEQVLAEVRQRVDGGCQEVVLTGTEVGSYHSDGADLKGLLERILAETDVVRLRLSSLQPQEISPELIGLWHDGRLCPHFHLSLQSGSDDVLQRMKRCYRVSDYQRAVSLIRGLVPDVAITTDIIVGFPGETEAEFEESYQFCWQSGFARLHVFPYSSRPGTGAALLPGQVSDKLKRERSRKMLALAGECAQTFREQFSGRVMPVLWEQSNSAGVWTGLTGNYIKVHTRSEAELTNRVLSLKVD